MNFGSTDNNSDALPVTAHKGNLPSQLKKPSEIDKGVRVISPTHRIRS